jgi:hypothetical protein
MYLEGGKGGGGGGGGGGENLKRLVMTVGYRNNIIIFRVGPNLVVNVVVDTLRIKQPTRCIKYPKCILS